MNREFVRSVVWVLSFAAGWFGYSLVHRRPQAAPVTSAPVTSAPVPVAPAPSAKPWHSDFDLEKRNREIEWCEHHGGVPDLTFDWHGSNVLCVKRSAVIPIPEKDGGP